MTLQPAVALKNTLVKRAGTGAQIMVVENWLEELKRRVPVQ